MAGGILLGRYTRSTLMQLVYIPLQTQYCNQSRAIMSSILAWLWTVRTRTGQRCGYIIWPCTSGELCRGCCRRCYMTHYRQPGCSWQSAGLSGSLVYLLVEALISSRGLVHRRQTLILASRSNPLECGCTPSATTHSPSRSHLISPRSVQFVRQYISSNTCGIPLSYAGEFMRQGCSVTCHWSPRFSKCEEARDLDDVHLFST